MKLVMPVLDTGIHVDGRAMTLYVGIQGGLPPDLSTEALAKAEAEGVGWKIFNNDIDIDS